LSKSLKHLTVEAVKAIQREVFAAHGGAAGIRDQALLESAVAAPQASMMGQPLISDPLEIAAAYLFTFAAIIRSSMATNAPRLLRVLSSWRTTVFYPTGNCRSTIGNSSFSKWPPARSIVTRLLAGFANCSRNPEEAEL